MCMCVMVNMYVCNSCQVLDLGTQGMRDQGTMWSELSAENKQPIGVNGSTGISNHPPQKQTQNITLYACVCVCVSS